MDVLLEQKITIGMTIGNDWNGNVTKLRYRNHKIQEAMKMQIYVNCTDLQLRTSSINEEGIIGTDAFE